MRILGIDPGEKNIGVAISDPTGSIANPLTVIKHVSRPTDAASIGEIALEYSAEIIVVGQALDVNGIPTLSGRRAKRLAAAIRSQINIPVILWDESFSTKTAQNARVKMGGTPRMQDRHFDEMAATVILQSYLDTLT
jgi:putative Holliday junction resolvase